MFHPENLIEKIRHEKPVYVKPLGGGSINDVYEFELPSSMHQLVIKLNDEAKFPNMLAMEVLGLTEIYSSNTVAVPQIFECGVIEGKQFLILEKIWTLDATKKTWTIFGEQLANLHKKTSNNFGFEYDNYIGSLVQVNQKKPTWSEFLITQRLQPMIELAVNQGDVNYVEAKVIEPLFTKLEDLYPKEKPSLLHGDLWSGNFLVGPSEEPVLIDPAVYYGHREMDLSMMHLFGGFAPRVFEVYNDAFPLEKNWKERIELNQLYPLLVHVNLFGRSYWNKAESIIKKYL